MYLCGLCNNLLHLHVLTRALKGSENHWKGLRPGGGGQILPVISAPMIEHHEAWLLESHASELYGVQLW